MENVYEQGDKMIAVKGRYDGTSVVLDSIPISKELGTPIQECEVIVNFPDNPVPSQKQANALKQLLKYRGKDIWEGDIEEIRSPR